MIAAGVLAMTGFALAQGAGTPKLPFTSEAVHLGVSSCGGSSCHGALEPWPNSTVQQNEFVIWQEKDPHAKAYKTLMSEASKRIAKNLGLPNAYEADMCLDCHADNVPAEKRAKGFQISDGVGCESCHGGAVNWLGVHVSGKADHAANVQAGLFPTEDPVARAKLCLSCHLGDADRVITHRIMGAGHPRLAFELDTYTMTQPAHFKIDADYASRKGEVQHLKTWAVGQAVAVESQLDAMLDPARNKDGIFPELVFFDCHSCHHPMSNVRWEARDGHGIAPGTPRLNDANLILLSAFFDQADPAAAQQIRARTKAMHQASQKSHEATLEAVKALRDAVGPLTAKIAAMQFRAPEMRALLANLIERGTRGDYVDYAAAEQATMAITAVLDGMKAGQAISDAQYKSLMSALDQAYAVVEKDEAYSPRQFVAALQAFGAALTRT
ncbi:MAG: multiheme c-type cytochrome [Rhodospirillaceae bacterium]|nr:multiheme c-type cytochrome [Rhodospirillaceae bacterium]